MVKDKLKMKKYEKISFNIACGYNGLLFGLS
jgi:hypothetical protein